MELTSNSTDITQSNHAPANPSRKRVVYECALVIALAINVVLCGLLALFIPIIAAHTIGIIFAGHCFWVGVPAIIAAALGIATYSRNSYEPCMAKTHIAFAIISLITLIGGFAILTINFVNLGLLSAHSDAQYMQLKPYTSSGIAINAVVCVFYIFFFSVFVHCIIMYCRIPSTLIGRDNTSLPVQLTQDGVVIGSDQHYNFYQPDVDDVKVHVNNN